MRDGKQHMRTLIFLLVAVSCFSFAYQEFSTNQVTAKLVTKEKEYIAGQKIILMFDINQHVTADLMIQTSSGSTVISSDRGSFELPEFCTQQKGIMKYTLAYQGAKLYEGTLEILANAAAEISLASYVGPPSITAGGTDYSMPVIIATDIYDNPLADSTAIALKHQFLEHQIEDALRTKDMIAWKRLFSYNSSGKMLVSSEIGATVSKEFSVVVFPGLSTDFTIISNRKHEYADGNQVVDLITSVLRDMHGNIISDGTLVDFVINNDQGAILKTQASTINGVAIGKIIHPDHSDTWTIKAYVPGVAESNAISIKFEAVLADFEIDFVANNREIRVGPLLSFMKQLIPDGAFVALEISLDSRISETKIASSQNGMVTFLLPEDFYPKGVYRLSIKAMGVKKEYKDLSIE